MARVFDRGDGQGDVDANAVFADALRLVGVDPLAAPDAVEDLLLLAFAVVGDQEGDVSSDRLRLRVAVEAHRTGVPGGDDSVEVLAQDRIVGAFDHLGKTVGLILRLSRRRFCARRIHRTKLSK